MGGCRCVFRNCKVNSYNCVGMHFFRFPLKNKSRCNEWIKYTQQNDLYYLPIGRQRNLSVCARHFRDEYFMNYKKDRLIGMAVPSIHRLSRNQALDYELDINNGVLVTLPEPEVPHLIAPPDFICPLGFDFDDDVRELLASKANEEETDNFEPVQEVDNNVAGESNAISSDRAQTVESIEISAASESLKRPSTCLSGKEVTGSEETQFEIIKRARTDNVRNENSVNDTDDNIQTSDASGCHSHPIIINHQIMDSEGRLWIPSDTFSLQDDEGYQLVEIHPQHEENKNTQVESLSESSQEVEAHIKFINDDPHLSHEEEADSTAIERLRILLEQEKENVKKLESKLSASQLSWKQSEQQVAASIQEINALRNANDELEARALEGEIFKAQLEDLKTERDNLEKESITVKLKHKVIRKNVLSLRTLIATLQSENAELKRGLESSQSSKIHEVIERQEFEQQMQQEQQKYLQLERQLQEQVKTLEQSLELAGQHLKESKNNVTSVRTECAAVKNEKLNSDQKVLVLESQLQQLQGKYKDKDEETQQMQRNYDNLLKVHERLNADYKMLENNQNQISTVTTSNSCGTDSPVLHQQPAPVTTTLSKAQLFNGIKRYISSAMCSLLRMEMFGSLEREWKPDERQAAVDLLRLGEFVYKYLTDEWRFRLPALRDVRQWLNQSVPMDEEEDL